MALHGLVGSRVYLPKLLFDDGIWYIKFFLRISVASLMNAIIKVKMFRVMFRVMFRCSQEITGKKYLQGVFDSPDCDL
jgi:hypothetical protein